MFPGYPTHQLDHGPLKRGDARATSPSLQYLSHKIHHDWRPPPEDSQDVISKQKE
jgi:hypothetical protein